MKDSNSSSPDNNIPIAVEQECSEINDDDVEITRTNRMKVAHDSSSFDDTGDPNSREKINNDHQSQSFIQLSRTITQEDNVAGRPGGDQLAMIESFYQHGCATLIGYRDDICPSDFHYGSNKRSSLPLSPTSASSINTLQNNDETSSLHLIKDLFSKKHDYIEDENYNNTFDKQNLGYTYSHLENDTTATNYSSSSLSPSYTDCFGGTSSNSSFRHIQYLVRIRDEQNFHHEQKSCYPTTYQTAKGQADSNVNPMLISRGRGTYKASCGVDKDGNQLHKMIATTKKQIIAAKKKLLVETREIISTTKRRA